jgi:hypothetical protein
VPSKLVVILFFLFSYLAQTRMSGERWKLRPGEWLSHQSPRVVTKDKAEG